MGRTSFLWRLKGKILPHLKGKILPHLSQLLVAARSPGSRPHPTALHATVTAASPPLSGLLLCPSGQWPPGVISIISHLSILTYICKVSFPMSNNTDLEIRPWISYDSACPVSKCGGGERGALGCLCTQSPRLGQCLREGTSLCVLNQAFLILSLKFWGLAWPTQGVTRLLDQTWPLLSSASSCQPTELQ